MLHTNDWYLSPERLFSKVLIVVVCKSHYLALSRWLSCFRGRCTSHVWCITDLTRISKKRTQHSKSSCHLYDICSTKFAIYEKSASHYPNTYHEEKLVDQTQIAILNNEKNFKILPIIKIIVLESSLTFQNFEHRSCSYIEIKNSWRIAFSQILISMIDDSWTRSLNISMTSLKKLDEFNLST